MIYNIVNRFLALNVTDFLESSVWHQVVFDKQKILNWLK